METDDAPLSPIYRAVGFFRLFCHTVVLTLAFAYVFAKMQILEPVRLLKIPLKIPPLPVLLAAALLLVCCTGLARRARGIWGLLGLYLSPLLLFAFLTSFRKYISGLHGDAAGAVAFMAGLFVTPVLVLIFGLFGISLNCVLLSLKKKRRRNLQAARCRMAQTRFGCLPGGVFFRDGGSRPIRRALHARQHRRLGRHGLRRRKYVPDLSLFYRPGRSIPDCALHPYGYAACRQLGAVCRRSGRGVSTAVVCADSGSYALRPFPVPVHYLANRVLCGQRPATGRNAQNISDARAEGSRNMKPQPALPAHPTLPNVLQKIADCL